MKAISIGLLGLGTVGTGVVRLLQKLNAQRQESYKLKTILVSDLAKPRKVDLSGIKLTSQVEEIVADPEIEIVVEAIGGIEPAFKYISQALQNRKHVVTANKALIAVRGRELFKTADENGVELLFEASVGGGIPIIKSLREGLAANEIEEMYGILNGTANYILSRMHQDDLEFAEALKEAQLKGFAEADPSLDVEGGDAAHKLTILALLASNSWVEFNRLYVEGITNITGLDIKFAKQFGYTVKLLAVYRRLSEGLDIRVHPTLVPDSHLLAAVNRELNAVFVKGDYAGETLFYGPGAGERPTASSIVSDIISLSRKSLDPESNILNDMVISGNHSLRLIPLKELKNRFYLRFFTKDIPGVLAKIAGVLGENGISIASVVQLETDLQDDYVPVVILTHEASEESMEEALGKIGRFDFVKEKYLRLRLF